jgi:hypothetical protein
MNRHKRISLKQNNNKKEENDEEERKCRSRRRVKWRNERGNEGNNQLRVKERKMQERRKQIDRYNLSN